MTEQIHEKLNNLIEQVTTDLKKGKEELTAENDRLKEKVMALEKKNKALEAMLGNVVVKLYVGGTIFETMAKTLRNNKSIFLHKLVSGNVNGLNTFFIDRSPRMFEHVLEFLRIGHVSPNMDMLEWNREADFYDLILPGREVDIVEHTIYKYPEFPLFQLVEVEAPMVDCFDGDLTVVLNPKNEEIIECGNSLPENVNPWIAFKFIKDKFRVTRYTIVRGCYGPLRNWQLQGKGKDSWEVIRTHVDDHTMDADYSTGTWTVDSSEYYNEYRIYITDGTKDSFFDIMHVNFWGVFEELAEVKN